MKRNRGQTPSLGADTKNPGGYKPTTRYDERNVNAGGKFQPDAPGLLRDTSARIIRGPGR
jgi:hypothetical protein